MNITKLIMIEGVPGSGKSSSASFLNNYLTNQGIGNTFYAEGSDHPTDLAFSAYLTPDEFDRILLLYPEHAEQIRQNSVFEKDYRLVFYRRLGLKPHENELMLTLESHESSYGKVSIPAETYCAIHQRRWARFAEQQFYSDQVILFESAFFQHNIHDLMGFGMDEAFILEHLSALYRAVEELHPVLFYLKQESVKETLERVSKKRANGIKGLITHAENSPYGKAHNLLGLEGAAAFWEERKRIELEAIRSLSIATVFIDNSSYDLEQLQKNLVDATCRIYSIGEH